MAKKLKSPEPEHGNTKEDYINIIKGLRSDISSAKKHVNELLVVVENMQDLMADLIKHSDETKVIQDFDVLAFSGPMKYTATVDSENTVDIDKINS